MSKGQGKYIGIKFTEKIVDYPKVPYDYDYRTPMGGLTLTVSGTYGGFPYYPEKMLDGDLTTYWWSGAAVSWIKFRFTSARVVNGFRWRISSGYYPKNFTISGSNDDVTYTTLGTFTGTSDGANWQAFTFANLTKYAYYKIDITSCVGGYSFVYEIQLKDNPLWAIAITGNEYDKVPEGTLSNVLYPIKSIDQHPTETNSLLLLIDDYVSFENVFGNLTVSFDALKGNISGLGGNVTSFSSEFAPSELIPKPDPNDAEHVSVGAIIPTAVLTTLTYINTAVQETGHVSVSTITPTATLTHINDL